AVIFTAQVITNVCGTLALLAVLFNADIDRGDILNNFLEFTKGFSPVNRGICLGNSEQIRTIHDAYATHANQIDMDDTLSNVSENDNAEFIDVDDFHYITYIQKDGYVWELDGLKYQPVKIAQCNEENWLEVVKPVLQQRMNSSTENELTFSLMAVTRDSYGAMSQQHKAYEECLQITQQVLRQDYSRPTLTRKEKLCLQIMENNNIPQQDILLFWEDITKGNKEAAQPKMEALQKSAEALKTQLQQLSEQKNLAKIDVERQKFDYFPFINALLTKAYIHQLLQDQSQPKRKKAKKTK
ncbi:ubiquitin carboxyl-terminal hydrolase, partial [Rhizopus stolonifer]